MSRGYMVFIVCDSKYKQHLTGPGHPECPARYDAIVEALAKHKLLEPHQRLMPSLAKEEDLLLCHTENYVMLVQQEIRHLPQHSEPIMLSTGDVFISPDSYQVALLAVGGVLTAVDAVFQGRCKRAFCVVRPPGHHACSNRGMGFCLFNNIAIGARYAQKKYGIERVAIVDWDVHHGNGTEEIFIEDPSVFYFSTHQKGLYPGTGMASEVGYGIGVGATLNCPIRSGPDSRKHVLEAFQGPLVNAMEQFQPQLILISAGFDAHVEDPLGGLNLTEEDFAALTQVVVQLAKKYAQGRVISVLEGGYNLDALGRSAVAHVKALGSF